MFNSDVGKRKRRKSRKCDSSGESEADAESASGDCDNRVNKKSYLDESPPTSFISKMKCNIKTEYKSSGLDANAMSENNGNSFSAYEDEKSDETGHLFRDDMTGL